MFQDGFIMPYPFILGILILNGLLSESGWSGYKDFSGWVYRALSFYRGYPDSEWFVVFSVGSGYNENIHLTV
jgi:hypothetical protein